MYREYVDTKKLALVVESYRNLRNIKLIGDSGLDTYTFGNVERISPEAPVPVLRVSKKENRLGMASNVALNLSCIGVKSSLYSHLGSDKEGEIVLDQLRNLGVNTEGVSQTLGPTIKKERVLTDSQQICRIDQEPSSFEYLYSESEKLISKICSDSNKEEHVLISDYSKGVLSNSGVERIIKASAEKGFFVSVDPGKDKPAKVFKNAFLLKPNRKEAEFLVSSLGYNETSIEKISEILLRELNLSNLVITLGKNGVAISKNDGTFEIIPTFARDVYDVCGAGDTVMSLLVASLASGASLYESAVIANCGASIVVSKKGTASVNTNELTTFLKKLNQYGIKNERSNQQYFERI